MKNMICFLQSHIVAGSSVANSHHQPNLCKTWHQEAKRLTNPGLRLPCGDLGSRMGPRCGASRPRRAGSTGVLAHRRFEPSIPGVTSRPPPLSSPPPQWTDKTDAKCAQLCLVKTLIKATPTHLLINSNYSFRSLDLATPLSPSHPWASHHFSSFSVDARASSAVHTRGGCTQASWRPSVARRRVDGLPGRRATLASSAGA
jgi:hypothetical protein